MKKIAPPRTRGIRAAEVILRPGKDVGWHITRAKEEVIVILKGRAKISYPGSSGLLKQAGSVVYISPETPHNVKNTGRGVLKYIYITSPVT